MRYLALALLLASCNGKPVTNGNRVDPEVTIAGRTWKLEVVASRKGRKELADRDTPDHALLVVHTRPRVHHYETQGRFDVLFLDDEGRAIEALKLENQVGGITSAHECRRALFLPPGSAAKAGDVAEFRLPDFQAEENTVLRVGGHEAYVELALSPAERQHGLMWRTRMSEGDGMLFVYDHADMRRFWMGNCYIDLDIAFFRADKTLINVVEMKKYADPSGDPGDRAHSDEKAMYVLEMNIGWFRRRGLTDEAGKPVRPMSFEILR